MIQAMRTSRRAIGRPFAISLLLAGIAAPVGVGAQIAGDAPAQPGDAIPPADMAAMPDIGIDWPDMDGADLVQPISPDPSDPPLSAADVAADAAALEQDAAAAAQDSAASFADTGEERRYAVALTGLEDVADAQFKGRFDQLSVLKQGEDKPANLAQINRRMKEDQDLLDRLLRAKGYYAARIRGAVAAPAEGQDKLAVTFDVTPGQQYLLSSVDLNGIDATGPREPEMRAAFPVAVGDPVDADRIFAARDSLAAALGEHGYPFAKIGEPDARIDHEARKGDLDVPVETGGYRTFGRIILDDEQLMDARHVQSIARFRPGDVYAVSDVEDLQKALVTTGLVSSVKLEPREAGDGEHVDMFVEMRPAPLRTIAGELGYGTGEGYRAEVSWQHRNLFPPEGSLLLRGVLGTQEQTASATYRRNNFKRRDNVLTGLVSVSNVRRDAYDARTLTVSGGLERQSNILFQKKWAWHFGGELVASDEADSFSKIVGGRRTFFIAALPVSLAYDGSDDLLNPTRGFRLGGRLSPELSFQGGTFGYARAQLDGSVYQPFGNSVVLAARARFGSILGSQVSQIAPSRRFYAGGGGSVRGYGYQAIGPRDSNNDPIGGKSLAEFSLETRVRFGNFGVVPFVDAGNISTSFLPRFRDLRVGAGVGLRYYSSFGPIRFDVGTPINPQKGDPKVAVYVSLGQAF
ncbi:translocation and assembly module TamA [Sphingobium fontiphilum]|uniref:Translocation and assembly module TamA n=1 Tax=Sphingobium fontiphilum TaxID=944425 RepID=A0A7W6DH19_9SPHN|nr:BamA/TamA family outer membrane protein [Sphingobium fontiphilum]MBB3980490.1 translocation and assembly module TamA [Sphingobium fontiphilum]